MSGQALSFFDLFINNHKLKKDPVLASRLLALCQRIYEISESTIIPPTIAAKSIVEGNTLGPIVFCTPELGRWSTVGGLGVMVDELAYGLALLGQEVWVISPYYERNRKGETGYLAKDPAGIFYKENITVTLDKQYILGVHEGEV
jgi:starch synthase